MRARKLGRRLGHFAVVAIFSVGATTGVAAAAAADEPPNEQSETTSESPAAEEVSPNEYSWD
jgi:hypothetical protein